MPKRLINRKEIIAFVGGVVGGQTDETSTRAIYFKKMLQIIPIYLNQGGSGNPNVLISFFIVIEAIIVLWGLCHLIHCFLIKEKIVNYFSFDETYTRSFCANLWVIFFCVTNFAAIIICGTLFVYSHFFSSI